MKILCLHGVGQNASVMEGLTSSIRYHLPNTWKYTFVDGENECEAPSGAGEIFSGPYYCWYSSFSIQDINEQVEIIKDIIEDEGPFDGLFGFSQGAALGATILIHHERDHPFEPPPFRFYLSMSGALPFSYDSNFGHDVSKYFSKVDLKQYLELQTSPKILKESSQLNTEGLDSHVAQQEDQQPSPICRMFWPTPKQRPVQVPSVHVYGTTDGWSEQSKELAAMFEPSDRNTFEHEGGHQIPSSPDVTQKICKLIEAAATKSALQQ